MAQANRVNTERQPEVSDEDIDLLFDEDAHYDDFEDEIDRKARLSQRLEDLADAAQD